MDTEPAWIDPQAVALIHAEQLAAHGGQDGVRDAGLLDSALNRAKNLWAFTSPKPDVATLAASLAFGIAKNHPFLDGNKRTAWVVCRLMLLLNGADVVATQQEKYEAVLTLAAGDLSEQDFTQWLRDHLVTSG